jgi:hypothetical protein
MGLLTKMRQKGQYAVLWRQLAQPDNFGKLAFAEPVELEVRFEFESKMLDFPGSQQVVSDTVVYLGVDVKAGDYLWMGRLADLPAVGEHPTKNGGRKVLGFEMIPKLSNKEQLRLAYL